MLLNRTAQSNNGTHRARTQRLPTSATAHAAGAAVRCAAVSRRTYNPEKDSSLLEVTQVIKLRGLRCSFCGKGETEVLKLVAGPRVYICDGCVAIASRMMNDPHDDNQPPGVQPSWWHKLVTRARRCWRGNPARRVGSFSVSG